MSKTEAERQREIMAEREEVSVEDLKARGEEDRAERLETMQKVGEIQSKLQGVGRAVNADEDEISEDNLKEVDPRPSDAEEAREMAREAKEDKED